MMKNILVLLLMIAICAPLSGQDGSYVKYVTALTQIAEDDQRYRKIKPVDWSKQNALDELNRKKLDELYDQYGFPTFKKVGKKGQIAALMVPHHSADCEWNKKWMRIILDNADELMMQRNLISFMFKRLYQSDSGFCREKEFIDELLKAYPKDIITLFALDQL